MCNKKLQEDRIGRDRMWWSMLGWARQHKYVPTAHIFHGPGSLYTLLRTNPNLFILDLRLPAHCFWIWTALDSHSSGALTVPEPFPVSSVTKTKLIFLEVVSRKLISLTAYQLLWLETFASFPLFVSVFVMLGLCLCIFWFGFSSSPTLR